MRTPLTGRAVVTGAGGGLGAAFVAALRGCGMEVVGVDLRGADRVLDVTDTPALEALADEVRPDVWINNAAILGNGWAADQSREEVDRVVAVNLLAVMHGTRAATRVMRARGGGRILNVASLASWVPVPGEAVYSATKHGVRAFSLATHEELRGSGVSICILCPDGIWTPMLHDKLHEQSARLSFTGRRLLTPEEVAEAGVALLESGELVRSVPRHRGLELRLAGIMPSLGGRIAPLFNAMGERRQQRHRELEAQRRRDER